MSNISGLILAGLLVSSAAFGDAYTGKEDIQPDGKPDVVYNVSRPGRLLPFKTYNEGWDGKARPKWWNGYGVDPSGVNYWYYWNEETECYEGYKDLWKGTDHCEEQEEEQEELVKAKGSVPEPSILGLLLGGILVLFNRMIR